MRAMLSRARTVVRERTADFVSAEIRRSSCVIVVDPRQPDAGVDGCGAWTQAEVEVRRLVERARVGPGRCHLDEHVVVDLHAVFVLTARRAVFLQGLEPPDFP